MDVLYLFICTRPKEKDILYLFMCLFVVQDHHESLDSSDEALLTWVVDKAEDL